MFHIFSHISHITSSYLIVYCTVELNNQPQNAHTQTNNKGNDASCLLHIVTTRYRYWVTRTTTSSCLEAFLCSVNRSYSTVCFSGLLSCCCRLPSVVGTAIPFFSFVVSNATSTSDIRYLHLNSHAHSHLHAHLHLHLYVHINVHIHTHLSPITGSGNHGWGGVGWGGVGYP